MEAAAWRRAGPLTHLFKYLSLKLSRPLHVGICHIVDVASGGSGTVELPTLSSCFPHREEMGA